MITVSDGTLANIGWGIRLYLATPRLQGLLALSMAVAAATAMMIVNTVIYVRDVLGGGETLVTVAYAASGAGSMLAALLLPRVLDRIADRTVMLAGGALMAVGMAAGMMMPSLAGLLAIWFLIGVGSSLVQTPGGRLLRRSAHEDDRPTLFRRALRALACLLARHVSRRRRGRKRSRPVLDIQPTWSARCRVEWPCDAAMAVPRSRGPRARACASAARTSPC